MRMLPLRRYGAATAFLMPATTRGGFWHTWRTCFIPQGGAALSRFSATLDVLCVGYACHDIVASVDVFPRIDTKAEVRGILEQGGGPAATAAVTIARLGGKAALLSAVGDDERGGRILRELEAEGVDISACVRCDGATSPLSLVIADRAAGTRTILYAGGTMILRASDLDPRLITGARVMLVDTDLLEATPGACRLARRVGVPVVLDAGEPKPTVHELLPLADYVVPPLATARWLTGVEEPEGAARALLKGRAKAVVVTMGAEGYVVATLEGVRRGPAFKVDTVDTTGAGDAFHGAFALALAWGRPVPDAARFAAAVAALKCRAPGGRTGLPTLAEVEALLGG